ncbi:MAG: hypothetical protein E7427_00675 [Ruminococcaceae bacterium]|nr:hypothetical protein [Oscillospiraceae bacterium]
MYNRYYGNSGRVEHIAEPPFDAPPPFAAPDAPPSPPPPERRPPGPTEGLSGVLRQLLGRLTPGRLETEDLLVAAVLYLLYRESGDRDFLLAIAAYLLL